ncbi:hypothetical protein CYMTET_52129, partial [Cymbomonas tetramitiformis]
SGGADLADRPKWDSPMVSKSRQMYTAKCSMWEADRPAFKKLHNSTWKKPLPYEDAENRKLQQTAEHLEAQIQHLVDTTPTGAGQRKEQTRHRRVTRSSSVPVMSVRDKHRASLSCQQLV